MKPDTMHRNVIIAALDRTEASDHVIRTATAFARALPKAELHLFHAVDAGNPPGSTAIPLTETFREAGAFLDQVTRGIGEHFTGPIAGHVSGGEPARGIVQLASDLGADLVIVGSHGKGKLERIVLGSVSQAVVRRAPCAVLVARPNAYEAVPEIEPPCPDCVTVQRTSGGAELWCARHATRHAHGRLHYATPQAFGVGSSLLRPEG